MPPTTSPTVSPPVPFPTLGQHVVYTKTDGVEAPAVVLRVPNPQQPMTIDLLCPPNVVPTDGVTLTNVKGLVVNVPFDAAGELRTWAWEATTTPTKAAIERQGQNAAAAARVGRPIA